ncbi:MAG TPA: hypothetical protein VM617_07540 [Thermoanaerobaculia bacterium]|nr:hypothetical protein [Thermoanaerobaculia bacterium]
MNPPDTAPISDQDDQHLQLLSIFHYVVGGLIALFSLFPLIHLAMGLGMLTGAFPSEGTDDAEAMRLLGGFFAAFAGGLILAGLSLAGCVAATGAFLARRTHYTFCLVIAGVECIVMPFGTVLGVFTLVVLLRDSVKAKFAPAEVA